jgi:hypothetical protein
MTEHWQVPTRLPIGYATRHALSHASRQAARFAVLLSPVLLLACAQEQAPAGSRLRVYAADVTGGAKACEVLKVTPVAGVTVEGTMKVGNDGGWCGLPVSLPGPKPFDAGLLSTRPEHGSVVIHEVGDYTRIDYTPDRNFAGSDTFGVTLIPGSAVVRVVVTVTPAGGAPKA